AYDNG
ncbi:RNA polymerase subunit RPO18, partial [Monkeypox virus]